MRGSTLQWTVWFTLSSFLLLLFSSVSAEISAGGKILPEGAGPVYDKYFGKPTAVLLPTTTNYSVSTPSIPAKSATKPPPSFPKIEETPEVPLPPPPVSPPPPPAAARTRSKATITKRNVQLSEKILKTALGVGLGLLALPVLQSNGPLDTRVIPEPPQVKSLPPPPPKTTTTTVATASTTRTKSHHHNARKQKKKQQQQIPSIVTSSITSQVFNLVKGIVGVGVLSLPAGVAAFGSAPSAIVPALTLITMIGLLSANGFALIGKVCAYTGAKSYKEAWSRSVGASTSWIPACSTTIKTFLACLAFSMVLSDTFASLLDISRDAALVGVTIVILLPLCLQKDLASLAPFSCVGVLGMAYTALAMTVRWIDGSYAMPLQEDKGLTGFLAQIDKPARPSFGKRGMTSVFTANSLILVCMLSTAFMVRLIDTTLWMFLFAREGGERLCGWFLFWLWYCADESTQKW
jgi:hypothetical protein